jgi:hypothetical protein
MRDATMGLVIFTKDIRAEVDGIIKHYSKPNIYFEHGYLMSKFKKAYGEEEMFRRLLIFYEAGAEIASDTKDMHNFDLNMNPLLTYEKILLRILEVATTLTGEIAINAINNYIERLQKAYNTNLIAREDFAGKNFEEFKSNIRQKLLVPVKIRFGEI